MRPRNDGLARSPGPVLTRPGRRRAGGFTLIELMVTVSIAVVLMVVAVPSFVQFRKNADLSDAVSTFVMATTVAKSAALKSGRNTFLVPNIPGTGWSSGWHVYVDENFNGVRDAAEAMIVERDAPSADITVSTPAPTTAGVTSTLQLTPGYLLYGGSGFPQQIGGGLAGGILVMATSVRSSTVIIDTTGRARSCTTGAAGCNL